MFRGNANQFDEAVARATDENLTSENWALILDVCDRVTTNPNGPSSAVAALIKRLAHRNANVQLYTLELANALSQNCGAPLHRELASRSFTEALIRLANDRTSHQQVKSKVLERMNGWSEMFRGEPDLGIMEQAYDRLRKSNPNLLPPNKPVKKEIEDGDRRKEEEELAMALELSLREKGPEKKEESTTRTEEPASSQPGTTAATVSRVRALYDFAPSEPGELAFRKGDVIAVLESVYKDWWKGSLRGQTGIFPLNYVEKLQDPTKEDLEKDAMMEGEVFAQIRNVEKLLSLLSVRGEGGMNGRDAGNEEEITELYNQTLSIRPKLIELIGKYSQKKDDFTSLNEKFIKARRDYEALLESSMSQPMAGYGYPAQGRIPSQGYPGGYAQPGYNPQQQRHPPYAQQMPLQQQQQPQYDQGANIQQQHYYPAQGAQSNDPYAAQAPSAAFHFLPHGAPPTQQDGLADAASKPVSGPTSGPTSAAGPSQAQFAPRPQSTLTLNSGNPSELGAGGYEAPSDPRFAQHAMQGYPSQPPPGSGYPGAAEPDQAQQHAIPPHTSSFDSQLAYQTQPNQQQVPQQGGGYQQTATQQSQPPMSPVYPSQTQYNAYHPPPQAAPPSAPQGQGQPGYAPQHVPGAPPASRVAAAGGDDASDFYR